MLDLFFAGSSSETLVEFTYRNYRGTISKRRCRPFYLKFGNNAWHAEAQWILCAYDLDLQEQRFFAMRDMTDVIITDQP